MRFNVILRYMGMILLLDAAMMLISACVSLYNGLDSSFFPLLLSFILTTVLGIFPLIFISRSEQITNKEGYVIVVGSWLVSCIVGSFPFLLWGGEFDAASSWFESVSGYTTTGATILTNVEALPNGLLFWRASTHLLGGTGVVMFALVVLPAMGRTKMTLSSMEVSAMAKDNYRYRSQRMVQVLLMVYLGMAMVQSIMLKFAGMSWFDAVTTSFSTVATGGFSTKNISIAYYNSVPIEMIVTLFMTLSSIHFGVVFATIAGKANNILRSEVSRYYVIFIAVAAILVSLNLWLSDVYPSFMTSVRYGLFQTVAMISTTGFATADSSVWTPFAITVLLIISLQCGCAGSTAGGIKADRILLAFKVFRSKILQQQHPNAVIRVKLNNIIQDNDVISFAMIFIVAYLLLVLIGTIMLSAFNIDIMTSFSAIIACMGNVGPGFGMVGSMGNYGALPDAAKVICSIFMLFGRLEIFGLIQLFLIMWWK